MGNVINIGNIGTGPSMMNKMQFCALLDQADTNQTLYLDFHSEGGSVFDGFGMYQAITEYPGKTVARVKSAAFSIASYLAMACDEIEMAENGYLMIHNPWTQAAGDDAEMDKQATLLRDLKASMVKAYSARTGKSEPEVLAMMAEETYINADQAVAMGIADRVIPTVKASRVFAKSKLPQLVFASLFGAEVDGNEPATPKETPVSEAPKKVAATVKQIKAAYPKASADFIVQCMSDEMSMEEVQKEMASSLAMENEELKAKVAAMEEELMSLKAKAEETVEQEVVAEEEEEQPVARRRGAAPVASPVSSTPKKSATQRWQAAIAEATAKGMDRQRAVIAANRNNPGLREEMLAEANG